MRQRDMLAEFQECGGKAYESPTTAPHLTKRYSRFKYLILGSVGPQMNPGKKPCKTLIELDTNLFRHVLCTLKGTPNTNS